MFVLFNIILGFLLGFIVGELDIAPNSKDSVLYNIGTVLAL